MQFKIYQELTYPCKESMLSNKRCFLQSKGPTKNNKWRHACLFQDILARPSVNFINVLHTRFLYKILVPKITKPSVTRENLPKRLTYKKGSRKMLMKLTPIYFMPKFKALRHLQSAVSLKDFFLPLMPKSTNVLIDWYFN